MSDAPTVVFFPSFFTVLKVSMCILMGNFLSPTVKVIYQNTILALSMVMLFHTYFALSLISPNFPKSFSFSYFFDLDLDYPLNRVAQ